jgi:hypothetical protein
VFDITPDFLGRAIIEPEDCALKMFDGNIKQEKEKRAGLSDAEKLKF